VRKWKRLCQGSGTICDNWSFMGALLYQPLRAGRLSI